MLHLVVTRGRCRQARRTSTGAGTLHPVNDPVISRSADAALFFRRPSEPRAAGRDTAREFGLVDAVSHRGGCLAG